MAKVIGTEVFRKYALLRIRRMEHECNDSARRMNRIIKEGRLPEEPVEIPFPEAEDDDPDCE